VRIIRQNEGVVDVLKSSMFNFISWAKRPAVLRAASGLLYLGLKIPGVSGGFNRFYQGLSPTRQRLMHAAFAKLFRTRSAIVGLPSWRGKFMGHAFAIPLRYRELWLDWDTALSLTGHDGEVKTTYANLLRSQGPQVFFDVGANYGTHSLLMSLAGLRTVSFEPNPGCHDYYWHLMEHHRCWPTLVKKGVGAVSDTLTLRYDPRETWNGQLSSSASKMDATPEAPEVSEGGVTTEVTVEVISIDEYIADTGLVPDLMKIDTEGFELPVFQGAAQLLARHHTLIVFESLQGTPEQQKIRQRLFSLLASHRYGVFALPFSAQAGAQAMSAPDFTQSADTNFIAVPQP
jgi:FkbM family methyltransferase